LAAIVYGLLGWWFSSKMIWIFSLVSMGSWLGTETGYMSGWGAYYLGMNYPLRFVLFGIVLTCSSRVFKDIRRDFLAPTRIMGAWGLSLSLTRAGPAAPLGQTAPFMAGTWGFP